ncbi:VOC family protein [Actinocorallia sp. API 0066]|uniref:VOC family protein n=1 Tax=Actinocorallia sp. API 0066 TaxID=2896846 RepID=UPI001E3B2EA6|nr:VOC family protein [Actinocorallia sp. API 0066]MCD0448505.1 VOC family protein [Actinocorallia sp. API 0066]
MTRIGNVMYPAKDLAEAVAFYRDALGLAVRFADGDRFAALDGGGTTLALVGAEEDLAGAVAASFKVEDVPAAVARLSAAGAVVLRGPEQGPHEVRALLRDPAGNPFVVYAAL